MKFILSLVFLALSQIACQQIKNNSSEALEIVVYKIKPDQLETYTKRLAEVHELMNKLKGFKSIQTFQSQEVKTQFVDQCRWETLADAQKAAQEVNSMPEFQSFFAMMDTVTYFDHINLISSHP